MAITAKKKAAPKKSVSVDHEVYGTIRFSLGATINMGDFNSARVDVGITLPFDSRVQGAQDHAYEEAKAWTKERIREETERLRNQ